MPLPHTKQVHPIEHLAPASPTVQALGWQGSRERAGMAPAIPSVQVLGGWVGADLTEAGLAPAGPTVQGLVLWVGAGPDGGRVGTAGSECPGAGWVGWRVVVHNVFCCPQAVVADSVLSGSVNRLYIGGSCGR
ncbi:hypothetical protein GCM10010483_55730 [Actinokineospora diospyrosa]